MAKSNKDNNTPEKGIEKAENKPEIEITEDESGVFKWYAIKIISGHENKVKMYMDAQIKQEGLEHKIRNVVIPLEKVFEIKGNKKVVKYKNFYPGYILIEADLDDEVKRFIKTVPSVLSFVGTKTGGGKKLEPIPLRPDEIKRLRALLHEEAQYEKIDLKLKVNDPVKVISGPFNNFTGTVLEVYEDKLKVKVMVSIFGRKTPIEFHISEISKEK